MPIFLKNLLIQSAMAGWSDGRFCRAAAEAGAAMVTLGGYNADGPTHRAGLHVGKKRREFPIRPSALPEHIRKEADVARADGVAICVNLRFAAPRELAKLCRRLVGTVDVIELNAHCRQQEFVEVGAGEGLLSRPGVLARAVSASSRYLPTLVKARAMCIPPGLPSQLEDSGALALHLDLMKPGHPGPDIRLLRQTTSSTDLPIIGNNSVTDEESFLRMLSNGATMASMARVLLHGFGPIRAIVSSRRCVAAMARALPLTSRGFRLG